MLRVEQIRDAGTCGITITVTTLSWLSRRIWPYALLAVIALWWLHGWRVGIAALFAFYGIAWLALYGKKIQARQREVRPESEW